MVASKVEIVNLALDACGHGTIADFNDETQPTAAGLARRWYDITRDSLLQEYPWKFASVRTTAAATGATPAYGYLNEYALPPDCLCVRSVYGESTQSWTVEAGNILTNIDSPIYFKYTKRVTNPIEMHPLFVLLLAARLARDWSPKLVTEAAKKKELAAAVEVLEGKAKTADVMEREEHDRVEFRDWTDARQASGVRWAVAAEEPYGWMP